MILFGASVVVPVGMAPAVKPPAQPNVHLQLWGRFDEPIDFVTRNGQSGMVYVAEKAGQVIRTGANGHHRRRILDLHSKVVNEGEQGLLSIAWDPSGTHLYVHYSRQPDGDTQVSRFDVRTDGSLSAEHSVLRVHQPASNHNGGTIRFDRDGNLLIALGDGGGAGDEGDGHLKGGNAQSPRTLLGKLLRITPTPTARRPYRATRGNPFVSGSGLPEIFLTGLRNPYRFTIDTVTQSIWIADVGQGDFEEVDRVPLTTAAGKNFGWARREGKHPFGERLGGTFVEPIFEMNHNDGACAVIGGIVIRDPKLATWNGSYLFADFCKGVVERLTMTGTRVRHATTGLNVKSPTGFGTDDLNRAYVLSQEGSIYRIAP